MGNDEEAKSPKSEKPTSPPPPDQTNIHVYPDWAAMQAFYGPRVTMPPYFSSAMASGHAPHPYIWAPPPQPIMPHYGAPYAAIYPPGSVYPHPAVPLGSHSHGHGVQSSPVVSEALAVPPLSIETPAKSSGNTDRGLMKKLKGFDGLAMSIGNGNGESTEGGSDHGLSNSGETDGSSDGSDGNTAGADQTRRKRSREGTPPIAGGDAKTETQATSVPSAEVNAGSEKVLGVAVAPTSVTGKLAGTVLSPRMSTALELRNPPSLNAKMSPTTNPQSGAVVPSEAWMLNERELKRERRKQSNRESARRSRLRKQAETEELALKVDSLTAENSVLKSEISRLTEKSEKLKLENGTLMEKLKNAQLEQAEEMHLKKTDVRTPVNTENLLSRVNNSGSVDRSTEEEGDMYEKNTNTGAKLHQLLDTSPRADAVAAG